MPRRGASAVLMLGLLAGCGSAGRVAQPEDDFLDQVEAECRATSKAIDKLDVDMPDASEVNMYADLLASAVDTFKDLDPPQSLSKDFDDMVASIDDQVGEAATLSAAIDDGDPAAIDASVAAMTELIEDSDASAEAVGALKCKGLAPATGFVAPTDTTVTTTANTPLPIDTVPTDTTAVGTVPIDTVPIDTAPIDTGPIEPTTTRPPVDTTPIPGQTDPSPTTTGDEIYPSDLNLTAVAPPGYMWVDYEQSDASGLYAKSVLGPLITSYAGGRVENIEDGHTASIFVITLNAEFNQAAIDQFLFWEGVDEGVDVVTPAGFPVRQKLAAFTDTDCLAYYEGRNGISICTFTDIDGLPILDGFIAAQPT